MEGDLGVVLFSGTVLGAFSSPVFFATSAGLLLSGFRGDSGFFFVLDVVVEILLLLFGDGFFSCSSGANTLLGA
jgi:hypothetical protein